MNNEANTKFDTIIDRELKNRLNRNPQPNEVKNADTDVDLVNEVMWQMINDLYDQLGEIKKTLNIK